jgi:hypothetical protein
MHVFGLRFCRFVDFSLVQCVPVLEVFVFVEAALHCLVVGRQPKLHIDGKGETRSQIYTVQQDAGL